MDPCVDPLVRPCHRRRCRYTVTSLSGRVVRIASRVNQPLRAASTPAFTCSRPEVSCASGLMEHTKPRSAARCQ